MYAPYHRRAGVAWWIVPPCSFMTRSNPLLTPTWVRIPSRAPSFGANFWLFAFLRLRSDIYTGSFSLSLPHPRARNPHRIDIDIHHVCRVNIICTQGCPNIFYTPLFNIVCRHSHRASMFQSPVSCRAAPFYRPDHLRSLQVHSLVMQNISGERPTSATGA
jgi:hypothetical protein